MCTVKDQMKGIREMEEVFHYFWFCPLFDYILDSTYRKELMERERLPVQGN